MIKQELYETLIAEYPDKNVHGLTKRPWLYALLKEYASECEMPSIEYLMKEVGFRYKAEATLENKRASVAAWLKTLRDGETIKRVDIPSDIYLDLIVLARTDGVSISAFLQQCGHCYAIETNKSVYDYASIQKLSTEYGCKQAEILKLLNLDRSSRQTIFNIVHQKAKNSGDTWSVEDLNEFDEENMIHMVFHGLYDYEVVGCNYHLRNNKSGKVFFCIERDTQYSFVFDECIPDAIRKEIKHQYMDVLTCDEFAFKTTQKIQHIIGEPCIVITSANRKEFARLRKLRENPENKEYAALFGLKDFPQKFRNTDEEIYDFLQQYADENNQVTIDTATIQGLRSYHQRVVVDYPQFKDSRFSDFIDFFGFSWSASRGREGINEEYRGNTDNLYRNILANEYAIAGTNIVRFKSTELIYMRLYARAKTRGLTLEGYIQKLGFRRSAEETSSSVELLKQLDDEILQEMRMHTTQTVSPTRNHHLVNRLKKVYQCQCQLCEQGRCFDIVFDEENPEEKYVEVHHIVEISKLQDEEGTLDRLNNLIVVCPNHHKWLHYHKGGDFRLKKQGALLTLSNGKDTVIVKTNHHLNV